MLVVVVWPLVVVVWPLVTVAVDSDDAVFVLCPAVVVSPVLVGWEGALVVAVVCAELAVFVVCIALVVWDDWGAELERLPLVAT